MSTTVTYKGETLTTVENQTRTLQTAGKYLEDDITLTDVSGGGGDILTTANITIINRMGTPWQSSIPEINNNGYLYTKPQTIYNNGSLSIPKAALCNGYVLLYGISPMQGFIASGDNVVQIGMAFYITGDGTVTLESDL